MTVAEATDEVRTQFQRLAQSAARLRTWQAHYVDALAAQQQAALLELAATYAGQRESAQAGFRQQVTAAGAGLAGEVAQIHTRWQADRAAFAWLAGSWPAAAAEGYTPPALTAPTPSSVRIGRLRLEGDPGAWDMPALAPLLGQSHVLIDARGDAGRATAGQALLQSVLLRLVLTCPPRRVQLTLCEPGGAGSLLAGFLHLPPEQRGPRVFVRPDELSAQLAQISEHITYVAQEQLRNVYATVEEYNAANPATAVPYRVLVIAGLPAGCDERTWASLLQVLRTGPAAGVYLLATLDSLTPPARNINLADLTAACTPLRFTASDRLLWQDAELGEFAVTPDAPPPAAQMNAWLITAGEGLARTASLSTNADKDFNMAAVRRLLNDALTDDDLDSLCLDHFKPVHDQFSAGMARTEKIRRLINYANKKRLTPRLIRHVATIAPAQVARWKARLTGAPQPR